MGLAAGTGQVLRALLKVNRPRGVVFYRPRHYCEWKPANMHGDFPLLRGVIFIYSGGAMREGDA